MPANVSVTRTVPQAELIGACSAVLCHGGSGTLMAALSNALPVVVLPLGADRLDNGDRVEELGDRADSRAATFCRLSTVAPLGACEARVDVVASSDMPYRSVVTDPGSTDFVDFYRDHYRDALKLATMLVRDRHRAAELTQDVFVAALRRWSRLARYDRPDLWLRRAVINRSISEHRHRSSERAALERVRASTRADQADSGNVDPLRLWKLVSDLPKRQAQALALVYGVDASVEDAAQAMRCSVGSVKTHLHRGRLALAERLREST